MSGNKEKKQKTTKDVKETVKDVNEIVKEETKKADSNIIETTNAKSWWNRIWSAIVGAVLAIGAMFGITSDKINQEKEMAKQIQQYTEDALTDIKDGKLVEAAKKLEYANSIGKDIVTDAKDTIDKIKNADKEDVKNAAIEGVKDGFSKTETPDQKTNETTTKTK